MGKGALAGAIENQQHIAPNAIDSRPSTKTKQITPVTTHDGLISSNEAGFMMGSHHH
jgi:hypothetical protein